MSPQLSNSQFAPSVNQHYVVIDYLRGSVTWSYMSCQIGYLLLSFFFKKKSRNFLKRL